MPWKESTVVSEREEFVMLAAVEAANFSQLCRRFGISRKTGYKWPARFEAEARAGLADRSRRPRSSPARTAAGLEAVVVELRDRHPAWGGRKLRARLRALGHGDVPAASTITAILRRHGRLDRPPAVPASPGPYRRFEHPRPNDLWQMDFKGDFALAGGSPGRDPGRCHPLTVVDDHSRYAVGVRACAGQATAVVRQELTGIFRRYGLPRRMLMDNGACWGGALGSGFTPLTVWLLRLGVEVVHGRPYHPQTQGKNERFNRTLQVEAIGTRRFERLSEAQACFDRWRAVYNHQRPHEALGLAAPSSRYRVSARELPEKPAPVEYGPGETVRRVRHDGAIKFGGRTYGCGAAFAGQPVAIRPTLTDGVFDLFYAHQRIGGIDLRSSDAAHRPPTAAANEGQGGEAADAAPPP